MTSQKYISPSIKLFADDCIVYRTIEIDEGCFSLQLDLHIKKCCCDWNMDLRGKKCTEVRFLRKKDDAFCDSSYNITWHSLERVNSIKYPGVHFIVDLKSLHVEQI